MEEQTQHSTPFTKFIHHSARGFQTWQELCTQVRREVLQAQSSTEIAYTSVSPEWGPLVVDSLDEDGDVESLNAATNYSSVRETLIVKVMSTLLFGCHINWMRIQELDWHEQNLVMGGHLRLLRVWTIATHGRFEAPYSGSRKTPNFCMSPDNRYHPSFVIECGDSESKERLMEDMRLWLIGARPFVKVVVIIMYARKGNTNQVEGKAELYVRDANANPGLQQEATIFPATQSECSLGISAGDLFGPVLPQDLDANTVLPLSIDDLRREARKAMPHMDLVPAT
ncbi:hypothetical protein CNMCM5623_006557 [Aspergillus felis]|uniref:Uncharacterized protein n=1 Tax=Aspergillus felis TaxID=1287682 RepID=A0A8H6QUA8_9EURO|nr:hypothetical protein CNMCM5623_006557 [Aspergillus felis]KAF7178367.1 hypothetical protein CNMCM7691_007057 [Aspergillus felis]